MRTEIRNRMRNQYRELENGYNYIDKTESLEKEIERFPSVYIEGAAGCGKTTMMRMLLEKYPEVDYEVFWMDEADAEECAQNVDKYVDKCVKYVDKCVDNHVDKSKWLILENVPADLPPCIAGSIKRGIRRLRKKNRMILIGREELPTELLGVFWNREMGLVTQNRMLLNQDEIAVLAKQYKSQTSTERLWQYTGGWAGIVDVILRLESKYGAWNPDCCWHEMNCYIKEMILDTLLQEEAEILRLVQCVPWVNEEMCEEILGISHAEEILGRMMRKGLVMCEGVMTRQEAMGREDREESEKWMAAPLFFHIGKRDLGRGRWLRLGSWYETHGYRLEQLRCLEHSGDTRTYAEALRQYCLERITGKTDDKERLQARADSVQEKNAILQKSVDKDRLLSEVSLNLDFMRPQTPLEQWVEELKSGTGRLLILQETKVSCLCDMRDLSGLFACEKRREKQLARRWKECLDEDAWTFYRLARMEYYLETDRFGAVPDEDLQLLIQTEDLPAAFRLNALWLLVRIQRFACDEERQKRIERLETKLSNTENRVRTEYAKAVVSLNIAAYGSQENLAKWLNHMSAPANAEASEENMVLLYCQAKGYLLMNQYEKAKRLLDKILPYLNTHRRTRIHAEALFEKAVAEWNLGQHGQALKSVIESFLVNGKNRYVMFYTEYGVGGREVLEAYIEWMKHNSPEGWHRKKKYNYGNVLHMPEADYLETILRKTKKEARHMQKNVEYQKEERLTMTETVILQYLVRGLTNAQICQEMNLKLPTVKGHLYNIYKKMNVKNRVQAVMKWKEETK